MHSCHGILDPRLSSPTPLLLVSLKIPPASAFFSLLLLSQPAGSTTLPSQNLLRATAVIQVWHEVWMGRPLGPGLSRTAKGCRLGLEEQ